MLVQNPNYLVSINNLSDLESYQKAGITTFLFALDSFSIGYENTFTAPLINSLKVTKYVLINILLTSDLIPKLKQVLTSLKVDGFIFEDVGLINILNELQISGKRILYMNHFNCNTSSVNEWLKYVDSVVISSELTLPEYLNIISNVNKPIVLNTFGYNEIMYSRRQLLSNFYAKYNLSGNTFNTIEDQVTHIKFHLVESPLGTVALSEHIFNGHRLLKLNNVLFFYLNTSFISVSDTLKFINNESILNTDEGFLDKPTIYKLRSDSHD